MTSVRMPDGRVVKVSPACYALADRFNRADERGKRLIEAAAQAVANHENARLAALYRREHAQTPSPFLYQEQTP